MNNPSSNTAKMTATHYGQKIYYLDSMIARKKDPNKKVPDYRNEETKTGQYLHPGTGAKQA